MKWLSILILNMFLFLTGCATNGKNLPYPDNKNGFDLNSEMNASIDEMKKLGVTPPVNLSNQTAMGNSSTFNNTLTILKLNLDAKPIAQKKMSIDAREEIPFTGGPIVKIQDIAFNGTKVKLIQIMCGNSAVKQKFDNPSLVKGWTTQIDCGVSKYMIIGE